jgi:hypothetical protein
MFREVIFSPLFTFCDLLYVVFTEPAKSIEVSKDNLR